jgi:hypothetical protein
LGPVLDLNAAYASSSRNLVRVPSSRRTPDSLILFGVLASMVIPSAARNVFAGLSLVNSAYYNDKTM